MLNLVGQWKDSKIELRLDPIIFLLYKVMKIIAYDKNNGKILYECQPLFMNAKNRNTALIYVVENHASKVLDTVEHNIVLK